MKARNGEPTHGTYRFLRAIGEIVDKAEPEYLAMAVDAPRDTLWRRTLHADYKANRKAPLPEVVIQLARCREIAKLIGIPVIEKEGCEADDLIASIIDKHQAITADGSLKLSITFYTMDKDLHQLVSDKMKVKMYDLRTNRFIRDEQVREHWGVDPYRVVEIQTLCGDSTDNVPGVPGLGMVKATALIKEFGSVKKVMRASYRLSEATQRNLKNADLKLCRQLVELRKDLCANQKLEQLRFRGIQWKNAGAILEKLGLDSFISASLWN